MNVGAFAIVAHLSGKGETYVTLEDYAGLGRRSPLIAALLTIFLLSLIGIPITGGFFAKFYVFSAALQSNLVGLTIIGVINSAIAAYYYLRIIVYMYMRDERAVEAPVAPIPLQLGAAVSDQPDRDNLPWCATQPGARLRHSAAAQDLAEVTATSDFCMQITTPCPKTGRLILPQPKLDDLGEDDNQREQHQRLDERQAENQRELNSRTGARVAGHAFAGSSAHFALAESGQAGGDRHAEAEAIATQLVAGAAAVPPCAYAGMVIMMMASSANITNHHFPHCVSP